MRLKVYVGGSSTELDRNRLVSQMLEAKLDIDVTSSWAERVTKAGEANPPNMHEVDRYAAAYSDLSELSNSDWLLLLMPPKGVVSAGAFLEFGYALARSIKVCVSGLDQNASIFTAMSDVSVMSDTDAYRFFQKLA